MMELEDSVGCSDETCQLIFYNHLILESIFKSLLSCRCYHDGQQDLKSVRTVCKLWNVVARKILLSNSTLVLNESSKLSEFCLDWISFPETRPPSLNLKITDISLSDEDLESLSDVWTIAAAQNLVSLQIDFAPTRIRLLFAQLFKPSRTFGNLRRLKLRMLKFFPNSSDNEDEEFYETDAPSYDEIDDPRNVMDMAQFPSLTSFSYMYYSFDGSDADDDDDSTIEWIKLTKQFHNIQDLKLTGISGLELDQVLNLFCSARNHHSRDSLFPIKSLEILIGNSLTNHHLRQLTLLNSSPPNSLQTLHLEIGTQIAEPELASLLLHSRDSLQELQLVATLLTTNPRQFSPEIFQDTCLTNLTSLELTDGFISSLDFIQFLPNLQELKIRLRNPSRLEEETLMVQTSDQAFPHRALTSLIIEENVSTWSLRKLCAVFPCISHLHLRMDDAMLRIVYEWWPKLTSLSIIAKVPTADTVDFGCREMYAGGKDTSTTCTDRGITGIPMRYMQWGAPNAAKHRLFPSIGDLKDLETLRIESWNNHGEEGITDLSTLYGFIELPKLRQIHLIRTMISNYSVCELEERGVQVRVTSS